MANDRPPKQERYKSEFDGLGIAAGIVGGGLVCLWAPGYLDATNGWRTTWFLGGSLLGLIGLGGALIELGRLQRREAFGDWAAALVLAGVAGILFVLERRGSISGIFGTVAKVGVVVTAFWVPAGLFRGVARLFDPNAPKQASAPGEGRSNILVAILTTLTALAGLATAVVSFLQASRNP